MQQRPQSSFYTSSKHLSCGPLSSSAAQEDQADGAAVRQRGAAGLAGALARRQRSGLVALACPDLPPSALSDSSLHLQAQQRARCALGRHERACASGYRPHLRAAATARAVMALDAGLATDEAAAARERQQVQVLSVVDHAWQMLTLSASTYALSRCTGNSAQGATSGDSKWEDFARSLAVGLAQVDSPAVAARLAAMRPASAAEAEERQRTTAFGPVIVSHCGVRGLGVPGKGGSGCRGWDLQRDGR